ncbi:uncharacterized protein LOC144439105 [Glandiceps talaboti]
MLRVGFSFRVVAATVAVCTNIVTCSIPPDCGANLYQQSGLYGNTSCRPCSKCPPGMYASRECEDQRDTECKNCSEGTYSTSWSRSTICRTCTHCPPHLHTVQDCTTKQNAKCAAGCDHGYFLDELTDLCNPCSSCTSEDPNYTPPRVRECIQQGMPKDQQCVPTKHAGIFAPQNKLVKLTQTTSEPAVGKLTSVKNTFSSNFSSFVGEISSFNVSDHNSTSTTITIIVIIAVIVLLASISACIVYVVCLYRKKKSIVTDSEEMIARGNMNGDYFNVNIDIDTYRGQKDTDRLVRESQL